MSAISAFVHKVEAGVSHVISVVETDFATMEHRVVAGIQVMGGDMAGVWKKVQDEAVLEVNKIEADTAAAKQKVALKLDAVKKALGM
jgi:hypothetical protein